MLSASLPPLRYRMTRLRLRAPCACARSDRNSGAANVTVNAATPLLKNVRRVTCMSSVPRLQPLAQLILRRSEHEVHEARALRLQLRVGPRPRAGRAQVVAELRG